MKVTESAFESGRCDFCQINEAKHTINGGAWWICQSCFDLEYGGEEE